MKNRVEKSGEISEEAELTVCKFVVLLLTIVDEFVYRELELIHPPPLYTTLHESERAA